MEPHDFTPYSALAGGVVIGLAASLLLWTNGRIAGVSGIVGGLWRPVAGDLSWRALFLGGLLAAGLMAVVFVPERVAFSLDRSLPLIAVGGLLVGFGTRLAGGCTSGHGVCGNARWSLRSAVATVTFIAAGMITVLALRTIGVSS